ncbi:MAG TPA: DoxX family membrane protein [Candidatus Binataceae bacterium]|nr:DoxX family membrane protein [Candidatus Binataceae bacterium]
MKIATTIVRVLLGLIFTIFGLNGFLHFLPNPPMPDAAIHFFGALYATRYMLPLMFAAQVIGGVLLVAGIFVPLALVILAPIVVNIIFFHMFLAPGGLPLALVVTLFELFLAWRHRAAFNPLFGSSL